LEIVKSLPYPFLRNCAELLFNYNGEMPFHLFLKQEFKKNPSWGSRDRRNYRQYCYQFWRKAYYADKSSIDSIIRWLKEANENGGSTVDKVENYLAKVDQARVDQEKEDQAKEVRVWEDNSEVDSLGFVKLPELSKFVVPISADESFSFGKWIQLEPPVWIKVVDKSQYQTIKNRLQELNIPVIHDLVEIGALAVSGQSNINSLEQDGLILIQDIGSQLSMIWDDVIEAAVLDNSTGMSMVWDACCGAGGKSLSLRINYPKLDLQCSDIRQGILDNCLERFGKTGLTAPYIFKHNLANGENKKTKFKIVLADIPCSGSGTWRRNPEERWFYDESQWKAMVSTQLSMIKNAASSVTDGGYLIVCTCSLFARENEGLIQQFLASANGSRNQNNSSEKFSSVSSSDKPIATVESESILRETASSDFSSEDTPIWELIDQKFCGGFEQDGDYIFRSILRKL
jgi:16S rRNA (cytosine967-C5)-methyltransferase